MFHQVCYCILLSTSVFTNISESLPEKRMEIKLSKLDVRTVKSYYIVIDVTSINYFHSINQ